MRRRELFRFLFFPRLSITFSNGKLAPIVDSRGWLVFFFIIFHTVFCNEGNLPGVGGEELKKTVSAVLDFVFLSLFCKMEP